MTLVAGTRLGPYEIQSAIGAGGMGEIYKARDTRLGRTVAIKVLPAGMASNPERRRRFEQEARAASALNHPHICVLHDIGRDGDTDFLVMEYLEGGTLAQRLIKGSLPLEQALELGAQIADALARAHRNGIVHRDLKPANVVLTKDGAKLLDFGLAKLKPEFIAANVGASAVSTQGPATTPGAVMGTVPYMAPEQLEGKETDARTDLFAFGCVLYEMLTARRAFGGESGASVISAIMTSEPPPVSSLQPVTPPALDRLVRRCLAKDPDDRWQHAADVAEELRGISQDSVAPTSGRTPVRVRRAWMRGAATVAVVFLVGAIALVGWRAWWRPVAPPVRVDVAIPSGASYSGSLALAPDGSGVVYGASDSSGSRLYWHGLDASDTRAIAGTAPCLTPFFSPDGKHLGFVQGSRLVKLALQSGRAIEGSPVETLADHIASLRGGSWGDAGTILYTPDAYAGLWRVSATGGDAREVTRPDPAKGELSHRWPWFLPGGRAALFTIQHASGRMDRSVIGVFSLDSGRWKRIIDGGSCARYLPTGHIVYARNGALLAVPFDVKTLTTTGSPTAVLNGVAMQSSEGTGLAEFSVSESGALVFLPDTGTPLRNSLVWLDRNGQVEPVTADQREYQANLDLSSDGQKLVVAIYEEGYENLWVYHLRDRRWQQLTSGSDNGSPIWSPSGDRLAFASNRDGAFNLYAISEDGEGPPERLTRSPNWQFPYSWSPDGRFLAYQEQDYDRAPGFNTWVLPLDGDRKPWLWDAKGKGITLPAFSPDGRWLAYQSSETRKFEVYVRPFPGPGPKQRVSGQDGGLGPLWRRDGREIMYLDGRRILAADVMPGQPLRFTNPHVAFALPFAPAGTGLVHHRVIALAPDGRRLITVREDPQAAAETYSLTLVLNWAEEVKAKLRGGQ